MHTKKVNMMQDGKPKVPAPSENSAHECNEKSDWRENEQLPMTHVPKRSSECKCRKRMSKEEFRECSLQTKGPS